jgi:DNA processing protein
MNEYWVWFSRLCKIDVKTKNKLLEKYKTPEKIWNLSKKDLERNTFLNQEKIEYILNQDYRMNLKKYIEYMEENQIHLITIKDKEYPYKLKEIYDSPIAIFTKGNKDLLKQKSIAIIGSRSCSSYGKFISKNFAYGLAKNNIVVISGLARGIDTYAHSGTLKIKNSTIAVVRIWIRSSLS